MHDSWPKLITELDLREGHFVNGCSLFTNSYLFSDLCKKSNQWLMDFFSMCPSKIFFIEPHLFFENRQMYIDTYFLKMYEVVSTTTYKCMHDVDLGRKHVNR